MRLPALRGLLVVLGLLAGCITWSPADAAISKAQFEARLDAADAAADLDEIIRLLEPYEHERGVKRFPALLARLRVTLGTAYEMKETREHDLEAIGVYARTLEMPDAPEDYVSGVAESLQKLTGKWCNASLDLLEDKPGEAVHILSSIERDGRRALKDALLGDVRYVLAMAYQAYGQPLRAGDMFMQHANMVEADQASRAHSLQEVAGLLKFDDALALTKGLTPDEAEVVIESLLERLGGRSAEQATVYFTLARVHLGQKRFREAVRALRSASRRLPVREKKNLLKLTRAEEDILDKHFGRLQVRCPRGMREGRVRVTIYGPLGREGEGIKPEQTDKPCSANGLYFIKGTYLVTSYGLLDSSVPSQRYQVVLDPGRPNERRKLITLKARVTPQTTYEGPLLGVGLAALAGGVALRVLIEKDDEIEELADTASVAMLATGVTLLVWALVESIRADDASAPPFITARRGAMSRPVAAAGLSVGPTGLVWRF